MKRANSYTRLLTLLPFVAIGGYGTPAWSQETAQPAAAPEDDEASTDIVVTAQKRSELLQDVPVSVSAITGDAIQKARITQPDDLVGKIPNLQLSATIGEGTPIFALRGVSMADFSLNQSPSVATYYDEVYKGNFAFLGVALYDLERVEVLRGPQGTLYGKNTTGGAVNLISRRPRLGIAEGYFNIGVGNYNRHEANGAVNVPLGPTAAARLAFTFARADGWFDNRLPGKPDLAGTREYGVRGSIRWEPSDGVDLTLRASTSLQNPRNYGVYAQPGPLGVGTGVYEAFGQGTSYFRTGLGRREIESDYTPRRRIRTYALALTSNFEIGSGLSLTSVSSWDKGKIFFGEDTDGSPVQTLSIGYVDKATQITQDLRLTSDWQGPFQFIVGAYFNREKIFNSNDLQAFTDVDVTGDGTIDNEDCAAGLPLACHIFNRFDQLKHSYAVYSDARYDFGNGLTLRGGLRFTHDKGSQKDLTSDAIGVDGVLVAPLIPPTTLKFKTDNLSGKIGLDYQITPDAMVYANYSRGYRGSSFNAQAFFDPSEASIADPEKISAFEVGAKTQFLNRRMTLNAAAFYYKYRNQQFVSVNPDTAAATLINLDRSRIYGGEVEFSFRASRALSVRAAVGLTNSRIEKGTLSGVDVSGNRLANAPELTFSGSLDVVAFDNEDGKLSLHPEVSYVSDQFFEIINIPRLEQNGYALFGGHIDYERGPFNVSLWAKNLGNKFYTTSRIDVVSGFGFDYNHIGAPRTFGITAGYKY